MTDTVLITNPVVELTATVMPYWQGWWHQLVDLSGQRPWLAMVLGLLLVSGVVMALGWLGHWVLKLVAKRTLGAMGRDVWASALEKRRVLRRVAYAIPLMVVVGNLDLLPVAGTPLAAVPRLALLAGLVMLFLAINGLLSASQDVYASSPRAQTRSIKGYVELAKLGSAAIGFILIISVLLDKSPLLMLSGLGALSAVLLLVFKDTLLSLVASTQMTANDMLRIGDWIEMPQAGADGFVIDFALHTVKVQNWDKTVTTIPTYKLFSESFRNWRHMFESGGRRIKRTLRIDAGSIRFLTDAEVGDMRRFLLLSDYLDQKQRDLVQTNDSLGEQASVPANRRRLTNIGTFRAYAMAYLKLQSGIHQDMLMLVRMMEPDAQGVPVEVYCFTNQTAWVDYERIQGDVFDHLLAILPEMGLRLYQAPAGSDVVRGLQGAVQQPAASGVEALVAHGPRS